MRRTILCMAILVISTTLSIAQESVDAKEWLINTITEFFEQDSSQRFKEITTEQYAEYKQDALCVAYVCDDSLTEEEFKQKWKDTYDISYAGIGAGFLIDQQDWHKIVVTKMITK